MLVHQVGSGLNSHGGPSYTVPFLCKSLAEHQVQVVLHALEPSAVDPVGLYQFTAHSKSRFVPRLGLSRSMYRALAAAAHAADVIHSHMLWMAPNILPGVAIRATRGRALLVMSPRGTLDPWDYGQHRVRKRIAWIAGQRMNLDMSACLHATAPLEARHFRALGLRAPIAVIPNGVEIPDIERFPRTRGPRRRLLFLARIAPKKGVDLLLHAWRNLQQHFSDWELCIAGDPNGDYLDRMRQLAAELGVERTVFEGPVTAERKWQLYRDADLYVLATRGDNWAVTISDALSFGVPAIVSREAPWEGLKTHDAGWWIDLSVDALTQCLEHALMQDESTLAAMGARGRAWMERDFSWTSVGQRMKATYQWLLSGGPAPAWVTT